MRSTRQEPALGWALFSYVVLITFVITLFPFRFQWPDQIHFLWFGGWSDTLLNVLFFLPLGFLYKLKRPEDSILRIFGLGLGLSCTVEVAQIFLAERFPSPMDALTNGMGAWLGALLAERTQRQLSNRWIGSLALELPLMNVVYLLIPLIWLNGLAIHSTTLWQCFSASADVSSSRRSICTYWSQLGYHGRSGLS